MPKFLYPLIRFSGILSTLFLVYSFYCFIASSTIMWAMIIALGIQNVSQFLAGFEDGVKESLLQKEMKHA